MTTGTAARRGIIVTAVLLATVSCQHSSEIVLAIDTDLAVPGDIDRVEIALTGAAQNPQTIPVPLTASGAPAFPLTLGLVSGGALSPVLVGVTGLLAGGPVVHQDAKTAFVEGKYVLLHMLLLKSCVTATCPPDQTCGASGCEPIDRPSSTLPPWTGVLPPPPVITTPIAGRTVWASGWHSAAIEGSSFYAWGQNADGQLGTGTTQNANSRRLVSTVHDPASVGLGQYHSCICDQAKQAWCWGQNAYGQLGTGNLTASLVPVAVPGLTDCEQIAGGAHHACVLHTDKTVSCWGQNTSGQVGQPAGTTPVSTPQAVPNLTDVAEVQCGELYSCARRNDGSVLCWGDNRNGQLGDGTFTSRATAAPVMGLTLDIAEIAVGRFFMCARRATGQVSCWGQNSVGQLGVATPTTISTPLEITGITDALQLAVGQQHACAIRRTGGASCWGANGSGQLGDGTNTTSMVPVDVVQITGLTSITAGSTHTCARHAAGLSCWGDNFVNQLGDGSTINRSRPVSVAGF